MRALPLQPRRRRDCIDRASEAAAIGDRAGATCASPDRICAPTASKSCARSASSVNCAAIGASPRIHEPPDARNSSIANCADTRSRRIASSASCADSSVRAVRGRDKMHAVHAPAVLRKTLNRASIDDHAALPPRQCEPHPAHAAGRARRAVRARRSSTAAPRRASVARVPEAQPERQDPRSRRRRPRAVRDGGDLPASGRSLS